MIIETRDQFLRQLTKSIPELIQESNNIESCCERLNEEIRYIKQHPSSLGYFKKYRIPFEESEGTATVKTYNVSEFIIIIEPFEAAVWANRIKLVQTMLNQIMKTAEGKTALKNRLEKVNSEGENLLHGLVQRVSNPAMLQLLLEIANELNINIHEYVNSKTNDGNSVIHLAVRSLHLQTITYLIKIMRVHYTVPIRGQKREEILSTDYGRPLFPLFENLEKANPFDLECIKQLNLPGIRRCLTRFAQDIYAANFFGNHDKASPKIIKTLIEEILSGYYEKFLAIYCAKLNVTDLDMNSEYHIVKKFCTTDLPNALLPVLDIDRERRALLTFALKTTKSCLAAYANWKEFSEKVNELELSVKNSCETDKSNAMAPI